MTTYGTMRTRIAKELGDPDDSRWTSEINLAIVEAIEFYEDEKFYFTEDQYVTSSAVTSTTTADQEFDTFPTSPDLVRLDNDKAIRIKPSGHTDIYPLIRKTWGELQEIASPLNTGTPAFYAVRGESVRWYPIPDGTHTIYWTGIFRPSTEITTGGGDAQTNTWMTFGASLIRNRAKKIVARDEIKDGQLAQIAELAEMEALEALRRVTTRKLARGRNRAIGPGHRRMGRF